MVTAGLPYQPSSLEMNVPPNVIERILPAILWCLLAKELGSLLVVHPRRLHQRILFLHQDDILPSTTLTRLILLIQRIHPIRRHP
jgi:hypothetical protein